MERLNEYCVYKYTDGLGKHFYRIWKKRWWLPIYIPMFLECPDEYETFSETQLVIDGKNKEYLSKKRICMGVARKELLPENYKISSKFDMNGRTLEEVMFIMNKIFDPATGTVTGFFNIMHSELNPNQAEIIVKRSFSEDRPKMNKFFPNLEYLDAALLLLSYEIDRNSDSFAEKLAEDIKSFGKVVK
jgi:hypothetical protein